MIGAGPLAAATGGLPCTRVRAQSAARWIRALRHRIALEAHRQPRGVHHDEHVFEAAIGLADQVRDRALVVAERQRARRARMNSQLVLDGNTAHFVALAERAILVHQELRHDEQRNAARAGRRAIDAREHHVNDVGRADRARPR